ncbi:azurin [Flavobacterium sp. WV_118_3]|uniref:azurin n=1 Tax=Flavobacterium sp. WV_118_3 TaxID=3151764 RepID=UPI0012C75516|nr:azurin [Flavobacterium sp.]HRB72042.1 azurin [Flavobacterium sp.]
MKKFIRLSVLVSIITMATACKNRNETTVPETTPVTEQTEAITTSANTLEIESTDQMQYSTNELKAGVGTIKLTLQHTGTMDKAVMGHNLIILKPGTDIAAFTQKAALAKATDYIPESEKGNIIAHTRLLGGGESDTIEFSISEPGTYDFLCSFPGHAALMKGKLVVE